jgi:hypothetical protein
MMDAADSVIYAQEAELESLRAENAQLRELLRIALMALDATAMADDPGYASAIRAHIREALTTSLRPSSEYPQ